MPKKALDGLTESMFYVLMALVRQPMCGIEASEFIQKRTEGRVALGPATLYTILGKFQQVGYIRETEVVGRKRTYAVTELGQAAYAAEVERLERCLSDARREERREPLEGEDGDGAQMHLAPAPVPVL